MTSSPAMPETFRPLKPGDKVRTPANRMAEIVAIFPERREALVMWTKNDFAHFRLSLLKPWREA